MHELWVLIRVTVIVALVLAMPMLFATRAVDNEDKPPRTN